MVYTDFAKFGFRVQKLNLVSSPIKKYERFIITMIVQCTYNERDYKKLLNYSFSIHLLHMAK